MVDGEHGVLRKKKKKKKVESGPRPQMFVHLLAFLQLKFSE